MELNLQEGDRLEAGAVLGYVDSTQLYLRKKQLEAGLRSVDIRKPDIRKQIASLEQQIAVARSEQQRMENLVKAKAGNQKSGTVLMKYAEPGEVTAAGKPLYKIADTDLLYLRAYPTAEQLTKLKIGGGVRVFVDFGEKEQREYPGTLTWISEKSEFTPKGIQTKDERANLVYAVKIAVKNDGYLKIGQYGKAKFNE